MSSPLLSLVVPTKNRYPYLKCLLEYLSEWGSTELEIVIQDNSDNNEEILKFLSEIGDDRIRYHHQKKWLSVSDNCNMAIQHATGEYLCMLGDDDGVTPQILDAVKWMIASNVDAILTSKPTYHWPGTTSRLGGMTISGRILPYYFDGSLHKVDVKMELHKVLRSGGTHMFNLPRVYHGIVKRSCMEQLRVISGTCFPGPSPDMANAIGLTQTVKTMYYLDLPLIINGNCSSSAGGLGARAAHHGEIHDMSFLPSNLVNTWPLEVPFFWSGPTILAASVSIALKNSGQQQTVRDLNLPSLYARCAVFHLEYADRILKAAISSNLLKLGIVPAFFFSLLNIIFLRFNSLVKRSIIKIFTNKFNQSSGRFNRASGDDLKSIELAVGHITGQAKYEILVNEFLDCQKSS